MISEAFGDIAYPFIGIGTDSFLCGSWKIEGATLRNDFANVVVSVAAHISRSSELCRYPTRFSFYDCLWRVVPETQADKEAIIEADFKYSLNLKTLSGSRKVYGRGISALKSYCTCPFHAGENAWPHAESNIEYCLADFAKYLISLGLFLGRLDFQNGTDICPTVAGLRLLVKLLPMTMFQYLESSVEITPRKEKFRQQMRHDWQLHSLSPVLQCVIALFSGYRPDTLTEGVCAMTDGRVYCHLSTLTSLSDHLELASLVQVGVGSIQAKLRQYPYILDRVRRQPERSVRNFNMPGMPIREDECEITQKSLSNACWKDEMSLNPDLVAMVEESVHLIFWYRLSGDWGSLDISPAAFVDSLYKANEYRVERAQLEEKMKSLLANSTKKLEEESISLVFSKPDNGEPKVTNENQMFTIRVMKGRSILTDHKCLACLHHRPDFTVSPTHGNQLGRITALVDASRGVDFTLALTPNKERLQELLEIWAFYRWQTQVLEQQQSADIGLQTIYDKESDREFKVNNQDELQGSKKYGKVLLIT
jgi:hypothetical protein